MGRVGKLLLSFVVVVCLASCSNKEEQMRLQGLMLKIPQDVLSELSREFTEEAYAKEEGVAYPVPAPEKGLQELFEECRKAILNESAELVPPLSQEELKKEAARNYPLYRKGDRIKVKTRIATRPTVEGILNQVHRNAVNSANDKVIIGEQWVRTADLSERDRIAMYPEEVEKTRRKYIHGRLKAHKAKMDNHRYSHLKKNLKPRFHQAALDAGYLEANPGQDAKDADCLQKEFWTTERRIFRAKYKAEFDGRVKRRTEKAFSTILPEEGFVYDRKKEKWRPRNFWERQTGKHQNRPKPGPKPKL